MNSSEPEQGIPYCRPSQPEAAPPRDELVAHRCVNGTIYPYPSLLCSKCPAGHGQRENHFTVAELCYFVNDTERKARR